MSKKIENGSKVTLHYIGKLTDGSEFDNSYKREVPLVFEVGTNQMIPGFESAVLEKEVSDKFSVNISEEDGYGKYSEELIKEVPKDQLGLPDNVEIGTQIQGTTPDGQMFMCSLKEIKGDTAFLDLNHPLAGKDLKFDIEILDIN